MAKIEQQADGQTVYFHAWGGSQEINRYIQWAGKELKSRYNVTLNHVKVTDISETTTRLIAEKPQAKTAVAVLIWFGLMARTSNQ